MGSFLAPDCPKWPGHHREQFLRLASRAHTCRDAPTNGDRLEVPQTYDSSFELTQGLEVSEGLDETVWALWAQAAGLPQRLH